MKSRKKYTNKLIYYIFEDDLRLDFSFLAAILNKLDIELNNEMRICAQLFLCSLDIYKSKSAVKKAWSESEQSP